MEVSNTKRIKEELKKEYAANVIGNNIRAFIDLKVAKGVGTSDRELLFKDAREIQKKVKDELCRELTEAQAITTAYVMRLLSDQRVTEEMIPTKVVDEIILASKFIELTEDPYIKMIEACENEVYKVEFTRADALRLVHIDSDKYDKNGIRVPQLGVIEKECMVPVLKDCNDEAVMSLMPNFVNGMKKYIDKTSGKVITFGLGLGYYAYMASEKSDVESVLIVENDAYLIRMFEQHILPQFKNKDKITIVHADAFEYMKSDTERYDTCFIDIFGTKDNLRDYIDIKKCNKIKSKLTMIWMEDMITYTFKGYVFDIINESLSGKEVNGTTETGNYIYDTLRECLKNVKINRPEHINYYMSPVNIEAILDEN